VGQVGRKIAATINELAEEAPEIKHACIKFGGGTASDYGADVAVDPWVLEATGMIHDLGHPPFGHVAEAALDVVLSSQPNPRNVHPLVPVGHDLRDGFEGNAQSFRIVTRLAVGKPDGFTDPPEINGLNLTRAVLSGMSKYPWLHDHRPPGVDADKKKWGAYNSEEAVLTWAMRGINGIDNRQGRPRPDSQIEFRSVEAQAMDWADDITYAVHDLEDFSRAGLIRLSELRTAYRDDAPVIEDLWIYCRDRLKENTLLAHKISEAGEDLDASLKQRFVDILGLLPSSASGRRLDRENFRSWATDAIDELTGPETLSVDSETGFLDISGQSLLFVEILKKLTWYFVIDRPGMASAQKGQAQLIRELFVWLVDWSMECYQGPEAAVVQARRSYALRGLPPRLIDYLDIASWQPTSQGGYAENAQRVSRGVVDFISSLTEGQAVALHARMSGSNVNSMLDDWFNA
jgi:dGTPase